MRGQLAPKEIPDANSSVSAASFRKIPFKFSICLWGGRGTENKQIKIRRRKKILLDDQSKRHLFKSGSEDSFVGKRPRG